MTQYNAQAAAQLAADPRTPPEVLAQLAKDHPALRAQIATHPRSYPGLTEWIGTQAALAARRQKAWIWTIAVAAALSLGTAGVTGTIAISQLAAASSPADTSTLEPTPDADDPEVGSSSDGGDPTPGTDDEDPGTDTSDPTPDPTPGIVTAGVPTIFIVDASGSMVRDTSDGKMRMDVAKAATVAMINAVAQNNSVGLLVFGTGTGNTEAERVAGCSDVVTLATLGEVNKPALVATVNGITPSGFTPIGPSLRTAAAMLPTDSPSRIVLISDGVDTCSPPPACDVAAELRDANPLLTIEVIGFAVDDDEAAQQQLTCIADAGGGSYTTAAKAPLQAPR